VYRVLVGKAEGERLIRESGKNRREILKRISEECATDLYSASSYSEDCSENLSFIKPGKFVCSGAKTCS
jgi:hypothetical protein